MENDPFARIEQLITEHKEDWEKAQGGNKAAGTRVRSAMQDIKNCAQDVRKAVLDMRSQDN